jgi:hypothetical protein
MKKIFTTPQVFARFAATTAILTGALLTTANLARADRSESQGYLQIAQLDRWTAQVGNQLIRAARAAKLGNLQLTHDPFIGDLGYGGEDYIRLNLRRGISYAIIGVCDADCRDLDLGLYDDNGNLVDSDIARDDLPVVRVTPRWNAQFTIRVIMADCSSAPCRYGLGAFGK